MVPSKMAMVVSISLQVIATVAAEVLSRYLLNKFLDQVNEPPFKPKGLYCIIVGFKLDQAGTVASVNQHEPEHRCGGGIIRAGEDEAEDEEVEGLIW
jgi:hypothetical protein